jgi:hypothetical protein
MRFCDRNGMAELAAPLSAPEKEARRTGFAIKLDVNGTSRHPCDGTWIRAGDHKAVRHFHGVSDLEIMLH